jgi:iron complex transport system substrate-binding protein
VAVMRVCLYFVCALMLVACQRSSSPGVDGMQVATTPLRIVSLTPGITELMYAVGAESSLLATVDYADYPEAARQVPRIGDAFRVDAERLLALKPDLVLDGGSYTPDSVRQQVKALGLRIQSVEAQRLTDVEAALRRIGELTGRQMQAGQAAQQFVQGVKTLQQQYAQRAPLTVFIEVNRQPLYTVNGQQIISEVVRSCGGINVFESLGQLAPVINVEAVLKANPQVILSTDGTLEQLHEQWQRWTQLQAVKSNKLYVVSPDTVTRATPRLLLGMQAVCETLARARAS